MLSSCWFTTPFTGCFSSAVKGGAGSGMQEGGDADQPVRVSQPPPHSTRIHVNVNGTAGGASSGAADQHEEGTTSVQQQPSAGQQTTPRTPRKSKSMGRIHGGGGGGGTGTEVGGGGGGGGGGEGGHHPPPPVAAAGQGGSSSHAAQHSHQHSHHQPQGGATIPEAQHEQQQHPHQQTSAAPAAAAAARTEAASTSNWHRGHRRVPSDGVAWRVSKGLEADRIIGGENMMVPGADDKVSKRAYKSEYRKKFRPFSQYQYVDGKFHKVKTDEPAAAAGAEAGNNWYKEVIELRKQAGQYRHRGWGVETASERLAEIYTKQAELWEQVSRRSSLQALSLAAASPSRPISKAEKDIENSRRSSPIKHVSTSSRERPNTAPPKPKPAAVHAQKTPAEKADLKSSKESTPRHHYDRTTGTAGGRSISVGPENRSPKRTSRPPSTHAAAPTTKPERRPRPTSLSTSARRKGTDALPHRPSSHDESKETKKVSKAKPHEPTASPKKGEDRSKADKKAISEEIEPKKDKEKDIIPKDGSKDVAKDALAKDASKEPIEAVKESTGRKSTPEPRFDPEKYEPVVKTPPEPTRVKSPDQVMVKSPDPVNWTVPLDTGKTFTVTHNIPEGESARGTPSSEHRHVLDSRTRQTPEPTKIIQGPLVGTPLSSITSDAKSHTQEQPKPATATTVEPPKVDDKPVEKKPDSSKPADTKAVETKVSESKVPEAKPLDVKAPEPKLETKVPETKPLDSKVEPKPSETKIPEVKPFNTKVEPKLGDVKAPEVKSFDTKTDPKASETKTDVKPCDTKTEPSLSETKAQEPKSSEFMPPASKPEDIKAPESKPSESKGPEPSFDLKKSDPFDLKKSDPFDLKKSDPFDLKKSDPTPELKSTQSQQPHQPLQQVPPSPPAPTQASPKDFVPPSSGAVDPMSMSMSMSHGAVDPMSMSMFGSLNGMNGKSSGTPSPTKPEVPLPSSEPAKEASGPESKPVGVRSIPGTNLRCLDDPSFMFDQPSQAATNSPKAGAYKILEAPMETSQPKTGGYRVLEAPEAPSDIKDLPDQSPTKPEAPIKPTPYRVLEAPIDPPARPKGSPYRVLEAPDAPYYPQSQGVGAAQESKPPSLVSPSSGRVVTDALDKARTRFDSFWGGPKDKDPPSKV